MSTSPPRALAPGTMTIAASWLSKAADANCTVSQAPPAPAGCTGQTSAMPSNEGAKSVANPATLRVAGPPGRSARTSCPPPPLAMSMARQQRNPAADSNTIRTVRTAAGISFVSVWSGCSQRIRTSAAVLAGVRVNTPGGDGVLVAVGAALLLGRGVLDGPAPPDPPLVQACRSARQASADKRRSTAIWSRPVTRGAGEPGDSHVCSRADGPLMI